MIWQEGEFFPITSNRGGERTIVVVGDCLAFLISVRWRWRRLTATLAFRKKSFQTLQFDMNTSKTGVDLCTFW